VRWLAAAGLSCLCFCAAAFGTFVPLRGEGGDIQYLYAWPGGDRLLAIGATVFIAFAGLFAAVVYLARRSGANQAASARGGRWLAPLTLLWLVALGLAPAVPGSGERAAPLAYFFYDLRWWWLGGSLALVLAGIDALIGSPLGGWLTAAARWRPSLRRVFVDALLFTSVIACAIVSTPYLRFTNQVHGDEPKYIRYCELWYQGGGFDISAKKMLADLPADSGPALHRIPGLLLGSMREDAADLAADLSAFAANPRGFRWNRSTGEEGFVRGKNGGVYQIYQPGASFTLFPGYFLDRFFSPRAPGEEGEFAPSLVMTNVMLLLMFGASAVVLGRLLRHALASDGLAAAGAALAMLTLPTTAFAFQFYPELPGLLLILLLSSYVLFMPTPSVLLAAAAGTGAAALAWLHPRFLLVSAVLAACGLMRSSGRGRVALGAAAAIVYCTVFAFNYHVTGSFLPTALWDAARPDEGFNPSRIPLNLIGYALDRTWGLAPHAPILLAVVPGLVLLARESWRRALFVAAVGLALAIPASAHTLNAAGGTPGRLIVAIVPLLVWPIAVLVRRFWSSWTVRALAVVAIVTSLDAGLTYNWNHHEKALGALHAMGRSGWRPNLAFPVIRDSGWESSGNFALFLAFAGLIVIATIVTVLRSARSAPPRAASPPATIIVAAGAFLGVVLATAATAVNGDWFRDEYLFGRATARRVAATGLLALDRCRLCVTSHDRSFDWTRLEPNPAHGIHSNLVPNRLGIQLDMAIESDGGWTGFGRMRVDFGDQSGTLWTPVVGEWHLAHEYPRPGEYLVTIWLQLRDGTNRVERRTIKIATIG
jgi:hypothetical protein